MDYIKSGSEVSIASSSSDVIITIAAAAAAGCNLELSKQISRAPQQLLNSSAISMRALKCHCLVQKYIGSSLLADRDPTLGIAY